MKAQIEHMEQMRTQAAMLKTAMADMADKPIFKGKAPPEAGETDAIAKKKAEQVIEAQKMADEGKFKEMSESFAKEDGMLRAEFKEKEAKAKGNYKALELLYSAFRTEERGLQKKWDLKEKEDTLKQELDHQKAVEDWSGLEVDAAKRVAEYKMKIVDANFAVGENTIKVFQAIALMSKAGAREQAALAGTMATVQAAQAIMNIWAAPSLIPDPLGMALKISETGVVAADTAVQIARISGAKFAGGTVSVPGTGGGDSVNAWVKPGEMIANQGQKDLLLSAIMNGNSITNNSNSSHTFKIDNSTHIHGVVDPRAVRDFNASRAESDQRLVLQLRRLNMSGQSQGVYSR
jgi:hypothetical protein